MSGESIDDHVVSIKFDNQQFEQKIADTMASLDQLSSKLQFSGAGKGFDQIGAAANSVNFGNMADGIDKISSKFDTLGAIGFSVVQKLTQNLIGFAGQFTQNDILGPVISGGRTRALEIAQAQFQFQGLGLNVQQVMNDALTSVKGTAFSLGDAAKAAAQFGASGITAGAQMQTSLRAIGGIAALTGTQFSDIANVMTQSAAIGHISGQDLLQFSTRGFNALAAFATQTGQTQAAVQQQVSKGLVTYQAFADAMDKAFGAHAFLANQTYTGSLDNMHAALARLGASFIGPELNQQRDLFNALTPVVDAFNNALQPVIFSLLVAKFHAGQGIIGFLDNLVTKIGPGSPVELGFQNIGQAMSNVFNFLGKIADIGKAAFKDIFPQDFGLSFALITSKLVEFTDRLTLVGPTAQKVHDIFAGLFSIFDIGIAIIKGVFTVLGDIVHALFPAGSGLFNAAAGAGTFLQKMDNLLVKGGKIQEFFSKLGEVIAVPVKWISELVTGIIHFFTAGLGAGGTAIANVFDRIGQRIDHTKAAITGATGFWDRFADVLKNVGHVLDQVWGAIANWFHELFHKIAKEMQPADFNSALDAVNVGLLGGITLMLKKFFAGGLKFGFGGGVFNNIKSSLNNVTRSLQLMQTNLKAEALEKIAISIAVLAAAVVALSLINSADLTKALAAMVVGFGELTAMLATLDKISTGKGALKIGALVLDMDALAAGLILLALAIKVMGSTPMDELAKGLGAVAVAMGIMVGAIKLLDTDKGGLISAGISIGIIAVGLRILADAVKAFGTQSMEQLGKGLGSVAVGLGLIVGALKILTKDDASLFEGGAAIAVIAVALRLLADVVKKIGDMPWGELGKGLLGLAGILVIVVAAMAAMQDEVGGAAAMIIIAAALVLLGHTLKEIGQMSWSELGKGLLGILGILIIVTAAMGAMQEEVVGAGAMILMAFALTILSKVLITLGNIPIKNLAIGLGAIAATFLVLGLGAAALTPVMPALLLLGVALTLIGVGFLALGAGAFLGIAALEAFIKLSSSLGAAAKGLATFATDFVVQAAQNLLQGLPTLIKTLRALIDQILETIIKEAPKLGAALEAIITTLLKLLQKDFPLWVQTGFLMLQSLLQGIEDNIGSITDEVATIIATFLQALADNIPQLVDAAANLIVTFLNELANHADEVIGAGINLLVQVLLGLASGQDQIVEAVGQIIASFIGAVGDAALQIIAAGVNLVVSLLFGVASALGQIADAVTNIITTFIIEFGKHTLDIISAGVTMVITLMYGIGQQALRLVDAAGDCILKFLQGLDAAINKYEPQIIAEVLKIGDDIIKGIFTGLGFSKAWGDITNIIHGLGTFVINAAGDVFTWVKKLGDQIVHGIWQGISDASGWLWDHIGGFAKTVIDKLTHPWEIFSPSRVMIRKAKLLVLGIAKGLDDNADTANAAANRLGTAIINALSPDPKDLTMHFSTVADQLSNLDGFNPVIKPVLDLSEVQKGAGSIADILGSAPITPAVTAQQAATLQGNIADVLAAVSDANANAAPTGDVIFNQTNNAPKELSTNEIYVNTKNQITLAKEELGIS